jgi:mannose-1-phosphate guanylyltransferase / mannose-6-phosphate isomerase
MSNKIIPVILAGGGGTRLWPLSREQYPKQYLKIDGEHTLLQEALLRLHANALKQSQTKVAPPIIICNEEHRFLVAEQARDCNIELSRIILEPIGRNTAPALTIAALTQEDTDSILVMMPADHKIPDNKRFGEAVWVAAELAEQGYLTTFGVSPSIPETGYGYIRHGKKLEANEDIISVFELEQFVEKPDLKTAEEYMQLGNYLWNSGIFVMKASTWLSAIETCSPEMLKACQKALDSAEVDVDFFRLNKKAFTACPADSIDYAVMEKLDKLTDISGAVIKLDTSWSDVGSWNGIWDISTKDCDGNVTRGDVHAIETTNSVIFGEHRLISTLGLNDVVVIDTSDAVLITTRNRSQDVKEIVSWLKENTRNEGIHHRMVYRPWGSYESIDAGDRFQVKRITVNPGQSLSLQLHHHRAEHWIVVQGIAEIVNGEETFTLNENESTYIPIGVKHRLSNFGEDPLKIIEVQSGSYLGEDDIVRFEDVYNRN